LGVLGDSAAIAIAIAIAQDSLKTSLRFSELL